MKTKIYESSFYWDSQLSSERKSEIIKWFNELSEKDQRMVEDLLQDARNEARDDGEAY